MQNWVRTTLAAGTVISGAAAIFLFRDVGTWSPEHIRWWAIYFQGRPIGVSVEASGQADGRSKAVRHERILLQRGKRFLIMEKDLEVRLDGRGALDHLIYRVRIGSSINLINAQSDGANLIFRHNGKKVRSVPLRHPLITEAHLNRLLARRSWKTGQRRDYSLVLPSEYRLAQLSITAGKPSARGRPLRATMDRKLKFTIYVKRGKEGIVRVEGPLAGMTARTLEFSELVSRPLKYHPFRPAAFDIPTTGMALQDVRTITRLQFKFDGLPPGLLEKESPDLRKTARGWERFRPAWSGGRPFLASLDANNRTKRYLRPEAMIQSGHPAIIKQARLLTQSLTAPLAKARKIGRWLYRRIEKRRRFAPPNALEVLRRKEGDCNEHTALFLALARACGIPARAVFGLTYLGGRFRYHAWPEIHVGRWISLDPTLNQFPADATHIAVIRGDMSRQSLLLAILGRIKIRILNITRGAPVEEL